MTDEEFTRHAATLGVSLDDRAVGLFSRYHELIVEANERLNLTAITERSAVYGKHFLDSLVGLAFVRQGDRRLVDIGSGAGLPGLALKIARPELEVTLVESIGKKADFIQHAVDTLRLDGVKVLPLRAEDVAFDVEDRERYDVAVARAVARVATIGEYALPLVRLDGRVLSYEGRDPTDEVATADVATVGGTVETIRSVDVPGVDGERHIVVLRKIVATPPNYPRRAGVPAKRPLLRT